MSTRESGSTGTGLRRRLAVIGCAAAMAAPMLVVTSAPAEAASCGFSRTTTWYGYFHAYYNNCGPYAVTQKASLAAAPDNGPCTYVPGYTKKQIYAGWDYPTGSYWC